MRFRTFRYVISADIVKMYRQILVDSSQTCLQRILWRSNPEAEINAYELVTLTYGTAPASYLATRCLLHLADQYASRFSFGSVCLKQDFYVDDMLTGADTIEEAQLIREEITQILSLGAFELSKWASNEPELLRSAGTLNDELVPIKDERSASILGIRWSQSHDTFQFSCELDPTGHVSNKRIILSEISRLFDPLGLLGPTVVIAKLIMQDLWISGINWDESLPQEIHTRWLGLRSKLTHLNQLNVPRCVKFHSDSQAIQLHGFCDASQRAYGACIYIRTRVGDNNHRSELLCSKSRVAPIKTISLPRLELSAALVLARLVAKVGGSIDLTNVQIFLWSDSTITLNWIISTSRKWSVFVANRVGEIQRLTSISN